MRKFSFFLVSLLCLCASTAWGIDWVGETVSTDPKGYYLFNVGRTTVGGQFLNPYSPFLVEKPQYKWVFGNATINSTGTISTTYNNNTVYIHIKQNTGWFSSNEADIKPSGQTNPTLLSSKSTSRAYKFNNGNVYFQVNSSNQLHPENGEDNTSADWFLIGSTQYEYKIAKDAVETYISNADPDDYPSGFSFLANNDARLLFVDDDWTLNSSQLATVTEYTSYLNAWLSFAEVVRQAYAAGYTTAPEDILSSSSVTSDVETAKNNYRAAAIAHFTTTFYNSSVALSFMMDNPDFEHSRWYYGWNGTIESNLEDDVIKDHIFVRHTGKKTGDNSNGFETGSTFAEMWVNKGGNSLASGNLSQTITLPAGLYTLSANVASRNITSYLYISFDETEVTLPCYYSSVTKVSQNFSLSTSANVTIGYKHDAATSENNNDLWSAIDSLQLTLKNQIENGNFQNPTFDYGWTNTGFNEQTNTEFGSENTYSENYIGSGNFDAQKDLNQTIFLPAGSYKLSADFASRNIFSKLYATAGSNTYAYIYNGEKTFDKYVIFTLDEGEIATIGYQTIGSTTINSSTNSWVAIDNIALSTLTAEEIVAANRAIMAEYVGVYNTFIESFPPAMRGGAPTINSTYLSDGDWVNDANNYSVVSELAYNLKAWTISHTSDIVIPYHYALHMIDMARRCGYNADAYETSINEAKVAETITSQTTSLRTNAVAYAKSNIKPGMDVTILIENNSFENNSLTGWTSTGSNDTGVKSNSNATYEASGTDGWYLYNTWDNGNGGTLSQTLTSIPKGYYRLSALLTAEANKGITLSAGGVSQTVTPSDITENDVTTEAKKVFFPVSLMFSLEEAGNVTISVAGASNNNWYKADNFTLQYLGEHPYQSYAMDIVSNSSIAGFTSTSYTTTISGTTVEGTITGALNTFRSAALTHVVTNSMVGQDITFMLENPDFEYSYDWNYGWTGTNDENNDGDKTTMSAFQKYSSGNNTYARMHRQNWGLSSRTLAAGDIYQSITLPAGTYKVEADIMVSSNDNDAGVTDTFYVKNGKVNIVSQNIAIQKNGGFNTYSLVFSLANETTVKIGAAHNSVGNMSRKTVAVDNFKLYYWETAKSKSLTDGYTMLYSTKNIRIEDEDAKVYSATYTIADGQGTVTLHENPFAEGAAERVLGANKAVLVYSSGASSLNYSHTANDATDTITTNSFVHYNGTTPANYSNYVLGKQDGVVAFYRYDAVPTGYNILQLPIVNGQQAPSMIRIVTEENTTTALIPVFENNEIDTSRQKDGIIYTILGIPVADMSAPGIYIQNGKKYVVR